MALQVTVRNGGAVGSATIDITSRVRTDNNVAMILANKASDGESSQSTLIVDDDNGEYGNSANLPAGLTALSIAAHNVVTVTETATTPSTVLLRGRVTPKRIGRADKGYMGRARQLAVQLDDYNADLKGNAFLADQVRPSETDVARATWIYNSFLTGDQRYTTNLTNGIISTGAVTMPAKTYEAGTEPYEVLQDCALAGEKNFFVMADGTFYYAPIEDTSKTALLRISDRLDEINFGAGLNCAASTPNIVSSGWIEGGTNPGNLTVPAGLNASMLLVFGMEHNTPTFPFSGTWAVPSFATQNLSVLAGSEVSHSAAADRADMSILYLLNPTPGFGQLNVINAGSGGCWKQWVLLENVDQATPFDTAATNQGTGTSSSLTITGAGVFINAVGRWDDGGSLIGDPVPVAGQTQLVSEEFSTIAMAVGHGDSTPAWTFNASCNWVAAGVAVNATANSTACTFPPIWDFGPASTEDGQTLLSGGVLRYPDGFVTETRTSVSDLYDYWVEAIHDIGAVDAADAAARLSAIIGVRQYEERTYTVAVQLHRNQVNLVQNGQMIQIKARAIPDADDQYQTRRIASLEWHPIFPEHYLAVMELDRPLAKGPRRNTGAVAAAQVQAAAALQAATGGHWEQLYTGGASSEPILTSTGDPIYVFVET